MRNASSLAILLIASASLAAPAPVWRGRASPESPYEVMLAELRKTKRATGTFSGSGGTWTVTVEKVDGRSLGKLVLTVKDRGGTVTSITRARVAEVVPGKGKRRAVFLLHDAEFVGENGLEGDFRFRQMELELAGKP